MNKKTVFATIVILLIVVATWFWWQGQAAVKAYEFAGRIEKVEGPVIFTKGVYENAQNPKGLTLAEEDKQIVVGEDTKLIKITQFMPTAAELEQSGGQYRPQDLRSEQSAGSLDDLAQGLTDGVFAKSDRNIYGQSKFVATEITYYVREYPQ
ncbi:MAG: hypothetical protein A3H72_03000 [Candidatus Doudnabacteria bacterium RIFCSPLOWO2_02_FULL_48_8]|uniref:Uncharacterized protein n=1 Tax=Candidatus Doudnabacteria bacterium RIFCSPHIGHO2_01_FULL_46_24 TaxID=1817825 RepID=A0A1F5NVA1_9BACT|nr:MAG: hypothetical protein A2720_00680 [Candidatus Doudnabacteria bacterium RIFCSPHIGHO2_01_FULL_46_24]OGE95645.1 MAG: hypothetical protein A3H72_03000 [Candidatus Doudnabacteria bacterium RIFCSPLOWO2_02_FULL_48_8]OGE95985.1 MAG: hypothetical protein A3E98_04140 [Candidatus Doudnabacteria bacterium RIFCSPHIGHO2_12_FULL_48_11]